jgi:hypothetical protein
VSGKVTVTYPGGPGIPPWKIVVDKNNGGNIVSMHAPHNSPSICYWPKDQYVTLMPIVGPGSTGWDFYKGNTPAVFNIVEQTDQRVEIYTGGRSPGGNFNQYRTYVFTKEGVMLKGEITPLTYCRHVSNWGGYNYQVVYNPSGQLPMRRQGTAAWAYMPPGASDGSPKSLPSGVIYPIDVEFQFRSNAKWFMHLKFDKKMKNAGNYLLYQVLYSGQKANAIMGTWGGAGVQDTQHYQIRIHFIDSSFTDATPPTVPSNLNAQAANDHQINLSWSAAADPESGIDHYIIYRNGQSAGTSNTLSFQDQGLSENTAYTYQVSAVNGSNVEGPKSGSAQASTLADVTSPQVASVSASGSAGQVFITFSEPVEAASAQTSTNYAIDNGITVSSVSLAQDGKSVTLSTSDHSENVTYALTVNNIKDRAGTPNIIAKDTKATYEYIGKLILGSPAATSGKTYTWALMAAPVTAKMVYTDRSYAFSAVDPSLLGENYLLTANDDKNSTGASFLSFTANMEVEVFIGIAGGNSLTWMSGWQNTGKKATGSHNVTYTLYKKVFPAGTVLLGGNQGSGGNMYTVFVLRSGSPTVETAYNNQLGSNWKGICITPNPLNSFSVIHFNSIAPGNEIKSLKVYDVKGHLISNLKINRHVLQNGQLWNTQNIPAGIYFVILQTRNKNYREKAILIK